MYVIKQTLWPVDEYLHAPVELCTALVYNIDLYKGMGGVDVEGKRRISSY